MTDPRQTQCLCQCHYTFFFVSAIGYINIVIQSWMTTNSVLSSTAVPGPALPHIVTIPVNIDWYSVSADKSSWGIGIAIRSEKVGSVYAYEINYFHFAPQKWPCWVHEHVFFCLSAFLNTLVIRPHSRKHRWTAEKFWCCRSGLRSFFGHFDTFNAVKLVTMTTWIWAALSLEVL